MMARRRYHCRCQCGTSGQVLVPGNRTQESRLQTQVVDAGSVERRKGDEKQQPENDCEGVRKHDVRPPVAASQIPVDLLRVPPFRLIGAPAGILNFLLLFLLLLLLWFLAGPVSGWTAARR